MTDTKTPAATEASALDGGPLTATLPALCAALYEHTGKDFAHYRRSTLLRRIRRRLEALGESSPAAYLQRLRAEPSEAALLLRELLVSVTEFFRDPAAFDALRDRWLEGLLAAQQPLRIWVPGCATGEEAYSLAMLVCELSARPGACQVFGTDLDLEALEIARRGSYDEAHLGGVSVARRERFFVRDGDRYTVRKELRDLCVFSPHNLLQDPPFSRLSLLSCRNVLIYLDEELHSRVLPLFHYALAPGGLLFLGSAETASEEPSLFEMVEPQYRLYRARPGSVRRPLELPLSNSSSPSSSAQKGLPVASESVVLRGVERTLLEEYAPPGAVTTELGELVFLCGDTTSWVETPRGAPPFDLLVMLRPFLREEVRSALLRANTSNREERTPTLVAGPDTQAVRVRVRPLPETRRHSRLFLLVFLPVQRSPSERDDPEERRTPLVERIESELRSTRELWRETTRALELSNKELSSSNEEYQALNEELQTSKEELQSINEELATVNTELRKKVEALDAAHADLQNLFDSTTTATILLDRELRVRLYSPTATAAYRLLPADRGRPLADLAPRVEGLDLRALCEEVLGSLEVRERHVRRTEDDRRFLTRAIPYRAPDGSVDGVVLSFVDVTTLQLAEENERRRAIELQAVLDAIPALVVVAREAEAPKVLGNASTVGLLAHAGSGGSRELELRRGFRVLQNGEELGPGQFAIERAARGERLRNLEVLVEFADGFRMPLLGNAEPLFDAGGKPCGAVAAFVDLSERMRTEAALRESEERYRTLAENARDFISRFDKNLRILFANPPVLATLGRTLEEVRGHTTAELGRNGAWDEHLREVFRTGKPKRLDWTGNDGRTFDVQLSPEREQDELVSVLSVARDITALRENERALRESEQRYHSLFARSPFGMALTSLSDGITLAVNEAFERLFECSRAQLLGRTSAELGIFDEASGAEVARQLRERGSVHNLVVRRRTLAGRELSLSLNIETFELQGQRLCLTTIEDVTERVLAERAREQAEHERERLREELAQAQKMEAIGTLAGGVAHDFNNLLGGILGGLTLLEDRLAGDADALRDLEESKALVGRGAELARSLLGFARKGKYDARPLDLARAIQSTCDLFGRTRRDLVLARQTAEDLWPVLMDHVQLEQVLLNLFVNAGYAMPDGGTLTISAENLATEPRRVRVRVRDTGVGMDEATRSRVFEPFFTTRAQGRGTGLGLATVFGIVTHHGGSIDVESEPGQGTTFTLLLPVAEGVPEPPPKLDSLRPPRGKGLLLVIDDEEQLLALCGRMLERLGYETLRAPSGERAVALLEEHLGEVDLALLDLTMPGMSGLQTFDALRALDPKLRVLVASGFGVEGHAQELLSRGAQGFLQKPFTLAELGSHVREALGK